MRLFLLVLPPLALVLLVALAGSGESGNNNRDPADARQAGGTTTAQANEGDKMSPQGDGRPTGVKGVYISGHVAGGQNFDEYVKFAGNTELNALVIDVKESGRVLYPSQVPLAKEIEATGNTIPDLEKMAKRLEQNDVYSIARLTVFQDDLLPRARPDLAVKDSETGEPWQNVNGATWSNPHDRQVWEYNVAIAKEVAEAGFDEIQFDYIRFPSDGATGRTYYGEDTFPTEGDAIAGFLEYAQEELEPTGAEISADVFGLAAHGEGGAGVGQNIPKMAPHLDAVSPMVYPSHFPAGSYGYQNPNARPYETVSTAIEEFQQAKESNPDLVIRPWLQDFDYGEPAYGPEQVRAQISAVKDTEASGWMLWNVKNAYTSEALEPGEQ